MPTAEGVSKTVTTGCERYYTSCVLSTLRIVFRGQPTGKKGVVSKLALISNITSRDKAVTFQTGCDLQFALLLVL